ncbi:MAG: hypothetical protein V4671_14945 [Armatimonadota bacterium]
MTQALCLSCGGVKFGALVPCLDCGAQPTEGMEIDILFSDHWMDIKSLKQFGTVIRTINNASPREDLRQAAFLLYISEYHPSVLRYDLTAEFVPVVRDFLSGLTLPTVELLPGRRGMLDLDQQMEEQEEQQRKEQRAWWKFWRREG